MFYIIKNDIMEETDRDTWENGTEGVAIFNSVQWEEELNLRTAYTMNQSRDNIRFCKIESHANYLFGTIHSPLKKKKNKCSGIAFYILDRKVIFIEDTDAVKNSIEEIIAKKLRKGYGIERFLFDFLVSLIDGDLEYLANIERNLTMMEEIILSKDMDDFNYKMLKMKKEISRLYRYYGQLTDLGEDLYENQKDFFGKKNLVVFQTFADRASRLQGETQVLREYAMQVQDVYQSEIGIRQNDVMKVLTIVTTIFLPLTLIAGWYGMNFQNMPELAWDYGYPMIIGISAFVIVFSLWLFKRKKFF